MRLAPAWPRPRHPGRRCVGLQSLATIDTFGCETPFFLGAAAGNIAGADLPRLAETIAAALERTPSLGWSRPAVLQPLPPRPAAGSPSRLPPRPAPTPPEENSTSTAYGVFKPGGGRLGWDPPGRGGDSGVAAPTRWLRAASLDLSGISVKTSLSRALKAEGAAQPASSPSAGSTGAAAAAAARGPPLSSRPVVRRGALLVAKAFVGNCLDAESGRTALSYAPTPSASSFAGLAGANADRTVRGGLAAAAAPRLAMPPAPHYSAAATPSARSTPFAVRAGTTPNSARGSSSTRVSAGAPRRCVLCRLRCLPLPAHACLPPAGLLLPEYIVEYEYVFEGEEAEARAPPPAAAVAADSAGGGDGAGPAAATAGLPTVELVARCGHRVPMTVQLRSLVDAARLLAVAAQSWLAPDALPAPAWQHLVRQLRGVPSLQVRRGPGGVRE